MTLSLAAETCITPRSQARNGGSLCRAAAVGERHGDAEESLALSGVAPSSAAFALSSADAPGMGVTSPGMNRNGSHLAPAAQGVAWWAPASARRPFEAHGFPRRHPLDDAEL